MAQRPGQLFAYSAPPRRTTPAGTQATEAGAKLHVHPPVRFGMFSTPLAGYRLLFTWQPGRIPRNGVISRVSRSIEAELVR
jgi:hypothetical protein